jgi:hypothetical protein
VIQCTHVVRALAVTAAALSFMPADAAAQPSCSNTSVPCQLSAGLPASSGVFNIAVAPSGSRVAFVHFAGATGTLYSALAGGGAFPVRLSPIGATNIANLAISRDSTRVVYTATMPGSSNRVVFSVPLAGPESAGIRLADHLPLGQPIISPDSLKVVMMSAADQLRVVPIKGPASAGARLTDPMVNGGTISELAISANSQSVVYRADQETDGVTELYRVPLTLTPLPDPPTTKLSGPMVSGGDVLGFALHPGTGRLAYHADQEVNDVSELYTVGITGAERIKVNRALPSGWDVTPAGTPLGDHRIGYTIVPGGTRIVYEIELRIAGALVDKQLYSVPIAGPATSSVRLDDPPADTMQDGYQVSSDSAQVVYMLWEQVGINSWGMSVPVVGPAGASELVTFPSPDGPIFTLSPDGNRLAWLVGVEMYSEPIEGGLNVRINGTETNVSAPLINSASSRVVYRAVAAGLSDRDLFSAPLSGSGTRFNLTQSLAASNINKVLLTGDGLRAVYEAVVEDPAPGTQYHLYSSRLVP